jgi:hypothetical protein
MKLTSIQRRLINFVSDAGPELLRCVCLDPDVQKHAPTVNSVMLFRLQDCVRTNEPIGGIGLDITEEGITAMENYKQRYRNQIC